MDKINPMNDPLGLKTWGMDELTSALEKLGRRAGTRRSRYDATKSSSFVGKNQAQGFVAIKVTPLQPGAFEGNFVRGRMKLAKRQDGELVSLSRRDFVMKRKAWWKRTHCAAAHRTIMQEQKRAARAAANVQAVG